MSDQSGASRSASVSISLTNACSNACVFCAHEKVESTPSMEALYASGARAITLTGGEPTLDAAALEQALIDARAAGFRDVRLQTNGHRLAAMAPRLHALGLTSVHLSVHGPSAVAHDYHTGREGSLDVLWAGASAAVRAGLPVVVTTVLTRSSYRQLEEMPTLLRARGIAAWHLAVPIARGRLQDNFDRVYPRLGMALPFALRAMQLAQRSQLPTYLSGAPLCLLGPLASRAIRTLDPIESRAFHARCEGCAARPQCPGVEPLYLARFDGDELRPREDVPKNADDEALASLFTGVGNLAPFRAQTTHEPVQRSRISLPMYGRAQRGQQEATTREATTGEGLRAILPALFHDKPDAANEEDR